MVAWIHPTLLIRRPQDPLLKMKCYQTPDYLSWIFSDWNHLLTSEFLIWNYPQQEFEKKKNKSWFYFQFSFVVFGFVKVVQSEKFKWWFSSEFRSKCSECLECKLSESMDRVNSWKVCPNKGVFQCQIMMLLASNNYRQCFCLDLSKKKLHHISTGQRRWRILLFNCLYSLTCEGKS